MSAPINARFGECPEIQTNYPALDIKRNCEDAVVSSLEAALELAIHAGTPGLH